MTLAKIALSINLASSNYILGADPLRLIAGDGGVQRYTDSHDNWYILRNGTMSITLSGGIGRIIIQNFSEFSALARGVEEDLFGIALPDEEEPTEPPAGSSVFNVTAMGFTP